MTVPVQTPSPDASARLATPVPLVATGLEVTRLGLGAWPVVTGAIVGARRPSQVDGWIGAAEVDLDDDDVNEISAALAEIGSGQGPRRPEGTGS